MTEEASAFIVSPRAGIGLVRSAGFQTCRIADFQVGVAWNSTAGLMLTAIRRFGNPGYSRFGNLRYAFCTWKSRGPHLVDILRPSAHSQTACFLSRNVVGWSASPRVLLDESCCNFGEKVDDLSPLVVCWRRGFSL